MKGITVARLFVFFLFFCDLPPLAFGSPLIKVEIKDKKIDSKKEISSFIYGLSSYMKEDHKEENVWQLNPGLFRFGGNTSERYNWKINSWNSGNDWYFTNVSSRFPYMIDHFMNDNLAHQTASSITISLLGWVAKDAISASFPTSMFPKQQKVFSGAGNGIGQDGKKLITDPYLTSIKADAKFIKEWITHLQGQFGHFPHHYIIGNEPMLWHVTHRDVHPEPATYDEVLAKYLNVAKAIREADPAAVLIGPALWGWLALNFSAMDIIDNKKKDRASHGDKPFLRWFLEEVRKEELKYKKSLIDVVDVHYYPEGDKLKAGNPSDNANRRLRINATRSLWDDSYTDDSWINFNISFVPRLKNLAISIKPDLKVAIGEYNFRAENDIVGAVVQAEILGIFASQQIYAANYWTMPPTNSPASYGFKIFRNYDGHKAAFGSVLLANNQEIKDNFSVFSSVHPDKKIVTIVLINKSLTDSLDFEVVPPVFAGTVKQAAFFEYNRSTDGTIKRTPLPLAGKRVMVRTTPLSINLLEIIY